MKRLISTIVLCFVIMFMASCASDAPSRQIADDTDSRGNRISYYGDEATTFPKSLPCDVFYNDTIVTLSSVDVFELYQNYEYYIFIIGSIDLSNLSDAEKHWLLEEDIDIDAYITSQKNKMDFESASALGTLHVTDKNTLYYVAISPVTKNCRHSFAEAKISFVLSVKQEETHDFTRKDGTIGSINNRNSIHYSFTLPAELQTTDAISDYLSKYITEWLKSKNISIN